MELKYTLLGTGSSGGVPRIGNDWGVCDPDNPRNRRSRCSAHVKIKNNEGEVVSLLIDTSPEMREQLLRNDIGTVDAVLYTHAHADQAHGIDDLRVLVYEQRKRMPIYADDFTMADLTERFSYCFRQPEQSSYPPILDAKPVIEAYRPFVVEEGAFPVHVMPLDQEHGSIRSLGFRIGNFAYCNDVAKLPEASLEKLHGLDVIVLDALRYAKHPSHANLEQALDWVETLAPKRAVLTNLHIDMDYETVMQETPAHVHVGYDGYTGFVSHNIDYAYF